MSEPNAKLGPHDLAAERALLGAILLDNGALYQALDAITETDLFGIGHRLIFPAMCKIAGGNRKIDLVTLCEELERGGSLEKSGGQGYIALLAAGVPLSGGAVVEYASIIKEKSQIRTLLNASRNLESRCLLGSEGSSDLVESAYSQLFDIAERNIGSAGGPQPVSEIVAQLMPELEKVGGQGIVLGEKSGFEFFDALTAGWQEGELVILAARPSMGKSALALDFMRMLAMRNLPVAMFNLEMSKKSIVMRLACRIGSVDSERVRLGKLTREEKDKFLQAVQMVGTLPMWLDDSPGLHIEQLQWRIKSLAQRAKIKLCVVDHIQLVRAKAENRTQEVTRISGGLQQSARELGRISKGSLLALSQLNRIDNSDEPQVYHLRESGSIEQDADTILFLWDELQQDPKKNGGSKQVALKVGKQRNGPTGTTHLIFFPARVGFEEANSMAQGGES